jgi:hypothetical protein
VRRALWRGGFHHHESNGYCQAEAAGATALQMHDRIDSFSALFSISAFYLIQK